MPFPPVDVIGMPLQVSVRPQTDSVVVSLDGSHVPLAVTRILAEDVEECECECLLDSDVEIDDRLSVVSL
jgi:hypothetical protein